MAKTEEEKKADADLEEFKKEKLAEKHNSEENAEAEEQEKEAPKEPLQINHEAELKKEREAREEAERKLEETRDKARKSFKERQEKREKEEETEETTEKPITATELRDILATERQYTQKELQTGTIALKAKELAGKDASQAEVDRIIEIHKERTFPAYLSLDQQLAESYAIVNSPRIIAQNSELKRSLLSKDTKGTSDEGVHKDTPQKGEPQLEVSFRTELQKQNYIWDGKQFKKKLSDGTYLIKDHKTGKTSIE